MRKLLSLVLLLLVLLSCVSIGTSKTSYIPINFEVYKEKKLTIEADKILYSNFDETFYILNKVNDNITILKKGKSKNKIGGQGFGYGKFTDLTDINLSSDGRLLALDRENKEIIKFDSEGQLIAEYKLSLVSDPYLLAVSADEYAYVYDKYSNSIIVIDLLTQKIKFEFGEFLFKNPDEIMINSGKVIVFDEGKSLVFSNLGLLLNESDDVLFYDNNVEFKLLNGEITNHAFGFKHILPNQIWIRVNVCNDYIVLQSNDNVLIGKMKYDTIQ